MPPHQPLPAFAAWAGASRPKMLLLGEAWGEHEAALRQPFVGESGKELFRMLGEAMPLVAPELHAAIVTKHRYGLAWVRDRGEWLAEAGIGMSNVLALRPPGNKLEALCGTKKELGYVPGGEQPLSKGKYLREEYLGELTRLHEELALSRPNLVIALGATASWAMLEATNIGSIRGAIVASTRWPGYKCLPTYHPAGVMRQWAWRPIVCLDLAKAQREAEFPEVRRPARRVLINPTIEECEAWVASVLGSPPSMLSCDIETGSGQIKCVGFASSRSEALVVPFMDLARPGGSYWPSTALEWRAWRCVAQLLECDVPKLFQNGMYDLQYLLRMGFRPKAVLEDTMLLHHALWPEMQKGLGFLGSIYTSEPAWKLMVRRKSSSKTEKLDE